MTSQNKPQTDKRYSDFIAILQATHGFDLQTKTKRFKASEQFGNEDFSTWFKSKTGKDAWYENDILALIGMGVGERYKADLFQLINIDKENLYYENHNSTLKRIVVNFNNESIDSRFPQKNNAAFFKAHKINCYGCPKNWAKFVLACDKSETDVAEIMKWFGLDLIDFKTIDRNEE